MTIERKKKPCKTCGEMCYIFAHGNCKTCAGKIYQAKAEEKRRKKIADNPPVYKIKPRIKRTPIKKVHKPIKQKPISKLPTERHKAAKKRERIAMNKVWRMGLDFEDRCHCTECGCDIGGDTMNPFSVAHIISKGANTALRSDVRNMILLCPDHHTEFDNEARSKMKVFDQTEEIREQLNLEYHTKQ